MLRIKPCPLPAASLLKRYVRDGNYTDCYQTQIPFRIEREQYLNAFYTTALFKLERIILQWLASSPSTDQQAQQLALGKIDRFAAWRVEDSSENQLLMIDISGRTRSWFMLQNLTAGETETSLLYFGSAVTGRPDPGTGKHSLGILFAGLLGFHKVYSRLLLYSARRRLEKQLGPGVPDT